jgi:hypothetical protein
MYFIFCARATASPRCTELTIISCCSLSRYVTILAAAPLICKAQDQTYRMDIDVWRNSWHLLQRPAKLGEISYPSVSIEQQFLQRICAKDCPFLLRVRYHLFHLSQQSSISKHLIIWMQTSRGYYRVPMAL